MTARLALGVLAGLAAVAAPASDVFAQLTAREVNDASRSVAAARPGLYPVPLPPVAELEAAVANQLDDAAGSLAPAAIENQSSREVAERYGGLARVLHAYELFESAEPAYLNAIGLEPADTRWRYLLGYLYQQTGRLEESARAFEDVLRAQPDRREAVIRLGDVYLQLNRLREARGQYESVRDVFPALARHGLGEVALRERRFEEAVEHFRAVLDRAPSATAVHYSLAMAYRGLGRLNEAGVHLERRGTASLALGDPIVDALGSLIRGERGLVMRGRRAYQAGRFDEAVAAFSRAVDSAPGSATARMNLGLALARLGRSAEATGQLDASLRLDPSNVETRAALGLLLADQSRDRDALVHLRRAADERPGDLRVRTGLVRVLLRIGRTDEAIAVLQRARAANPDEEDVVVSLSILLAGRDRFHEAVALLEDAYRAHPDRVATATTLARLLSSSPDRTVRNGARALGIAEAVHAAEATPVHAETVALALAELQRCQEAAEWLRRAIDAAKASGDAVETKRLTAELPAYEAASCRR